MTYRQADELGAHIRKGEQGSMVVYADHFTKTDTNDQGEEIEQDIPFMKAYTVFNVEQIEDLPTHYYSKLEPKDEPLQLIAIAERFFTATGASFRHGGNQAFYAPGPDFIQLPPPEAFDDAERAMPPPKHTAYPLDGPPSPPGASPGQALWRQCLCRRGIDCRTRSSVSVC